MAVPIIVGGLALASSLWGAKKGYDAKKNYDEAKRVVRNAIAELEESRDLLDEQKQQTNAGLQRLGERRLTTESGQMARFVAAIRKVNQVSYRSIDLGGRQVDIQAPDFQEIAARSYEAADMLKDGIGAVSSGVLTGIGVGGLATQIGVASTGTAIGTLSGAAATNATLAWLGGGSLAAGGMGVAGGTAILGGAIAGPVIAVMGYSAAKKSEIALTDAFAKEAEILEANEQVRNGITVLKGIERRANELDEVIGQLSKRFEVQLTRAEALLATKGQLLARLQSDKDEKLSAYNQTNWLVRLWHKITGKRPAFEFADPFSFNNFSASERETYMVLTALGYALYALLKVKVLDDDGNVSDQGEKAMAEGRALLETAQ
jgi:hypothetical protein